VTADEAGPLERLLKRERAVTVGGLALLCVLAWTYLAWGAGFGRMSDMAGMEGMAMEAMSPEPVTTWDLGRWALVVVMWITMMVAMMTPAAAPVVLLYGRVARRAAAQVGARAVAPPGAFALGYFLVWTGFAILAAALHWALEAGGLVSAGSMSSQNRWLSVGVLAAAGVYQFTPWQAVCLGHCRSPADFLSRNWRPGVAGAIRLGVRHGAYCVGCCWLIMALLFVGGVMNLAWIAGIGVLVLAERVLPGGPWVARVAGLALLAWATVILLA
jgi:predicted metal-binding membrane protein